MLGILQVDVMMKLKGIWKCFSESTVSFSKLITCVAVVAVMSVFVGM